MGASDWLADSVWQQFPGVAFLESRLVGERIYLKLEARGLGACAVGAFYDEEASALVGAEPGQEWGLHFARVGVRGR